MCVSRSLPMRLQVGMFQAVGLEVKTKSYLEKPLEKQICKYPT